MSVNNPSESSPLLPRDDDERRNEAAEQHPHPHHHTISLVEVPPAAAPPTPTTFRAKLHQLLNGDTQAANILSAFTRLVIVVALASFVLSTVDDWYENAKTSFDGIEWVVSILFSIEYVLRVYASVEIAFYGRFGRVLGRLRFMVSVAAVIDLVAVVPFWVGFAFEEHGDYKFSGALRALRLVRVFKVDKHNKTIALIVKAWKESVDVIVTAFAHVLIALFIFATALYYTERNNPKLYYLFDSIPATMFYTLIMFTGDQEFATSLSLWGKILAVGIIFIAVTVFAVPTALLGSGFSRAFAEAAKGEGQEVECPNCEHQFTVHLGEEDE